jgi:hypothetical protein
MKPGWIFRAIYDERWTLLVYLIAAVALGVALLFYTFSR